MAWSMAPHRSTSGSAAPAPRSQRCRAPPPTAAPSPRSPSPAPWSARGWSPSSSRRATAALRVADCRPSWIATSVPTWTATFRPAASLAFALLAAGSSGWTPSSAGPQLPGWKAPLSSSPEAAIRRGRRADSPRHHHPQVGEGRPCRRGQSWHRRRRRRARLLGRRPHPGRVTGSTSPCGPGALVPPRTASRGTRCGPSTGRVTLLGTSNGS